MAREKYLTLPIITVMAGIAYLYYATVFVIIDEWLGLATAAGIANAAAFSVLAVMTVATYVVAAFRDPGSVPGSFMPDVEDRESPIHHEIKRKGRNWADLPGDMIIELGNLMTNTTDYIHLRAVCPHWRRSCQRRSRPFCFLLFSTPCRIELDGVNELWSMDLSTVFGMSSSIDIPEVTGRTFCGSNDGQLILRTNGLRRPFSISILHPYTRVHDFLPNLDYLPDKIVLLSGVAMAVVGLDIEQPLLFRIPGGIEWESPNIDGWTPLLHDLNVYGGCLVAVDSQGWVYMFETPLPMGQPVLFGNVQATELLLPRKYYVIPFYQSLFVVVRHFFVIPDDEDPNVSLEPWTSRTRPYSGKIH